HRSPWCITQTLMLRLGNTVSSVTTMVQQVVLLQLIAVTALTCESVTADITCYYCSDNPSDESYDPACGIYEYQGQTQNFGEYHDTCTITIYDKGYVLRGVSAGPFEDGECFEQDGYYTGCHCRGDLCNTHSFCAQCGYPKPTPTPAETLKCYQCIDCAIVDEDTTPVVEDKYLSCASTVFMNSTEVIRSGSYEEHTDGECIQHMETLTCWCSQDLCNNDQIGL
ncbi:unnamed protein product, partial [Meganyctiphanes norvegica]